jgi:hypothetical protein
MLENRSFDEYFGTFPGAKRFYDDPNSVCQNAWISTSLHCLGFFFVAANMPLAVPLVGLHCQEGAVAKHSDGRNYSTRLALLALLFLSVGALAFVSDAALAQQQQRLQVRPAATGINPPQQTNTAPDTTPVPSPAIDKTSALGQALVACNQEADQGPFTLPGLKGEVTLDRCYKGRAHLICVFTTLSTEAKSLTDSYSKIVVPNILNSIQLMAFVSSVRKLSHPILLDLKTSQRDLRI